MLSTEEVLKKFYSQAPQIYLTVDSEEVGNKMEKINKKYDIDISDLIIRIFTDELEIEEIPSFLQREFNLEEERAREISEEIKKEIIIPTAERIYFLDPNPEKTTISLDREKEILENIFSQNLISELSKHSLIRDAVNKQIFRVLGAEGDLDFKKTLEKNLFKNQESLTSPQFRMEGKPTRPTVSNWIKHYVKQKGSDMPDNMKIVDFLVNSPNAKKLDSKEKKLLEKVLWVYRNLKFFPESMSSDEGENWQIFPLEEEEMKVSKEESSAPEKKQFFSEEDQEEDFSSQIESLEDEDKTDLEKIEDLEEMAQRYESGSLERRAIEDEIEKIKAK